MTSLRTDFALVLMIYGLCGLLVVPSQKLAVRYWHASPPAPGFEFRGAVIVAGSLIVLLCASLLASSANSQEPR